jgi:pimeloyl-ACP methyl ester carboxylesterase
MVATIVFVHGAWHGAWCFDRVVPLLGHAGIQAIAVDLPGHGNDTGEFTDLSGDAARVRDVLDRIPGEVILCGHSYGGAVITEAGVHPAVSQLVYLSALPLSEGESCVSAAVEESTHLSHDGRPNLVDGLIAHQDGTTTLTAEGAATCLYNDCDEATVHWAVSRLGPQPMANLEQTPAAAAWRDRPSTYVVCADDQTVHPGLQRLLAQRCTRTYEWKTGHSPFASQPELVAGLLTNLATG